MSNGVEYKPFINLPVQLPRKLEDNVISYSNQDEIQNVPSQNFSDASNSKTKTKVLAVAVGVMALAGGIIWGLPALRHMFFDKNKKSKTLSKKIFKNLHDSKTFKIFKEKFEKFADTIENRITNPIKNFLRQNLFNYIDIGGKK